MKNGVQINDHNNIWVNFDFGYSLAFFDTVMPLGLKKKKSNYLQFLFIFFVDIFKGGGHKCFTNIYSLHSDEQPTVILLNSKLLTVNFA